MSTTKHKSVSELRRILASPCSRTERAEAYASLRAIQRGFRSVVR